MFSLPKIWSTTFDKIIIIRIRVIIIVFIEAGDGTIMREMIM